MRSFKNKEEALEFVSQVLCWGNAAGTCRDLKTAQEYAELGMTAVNFGSITLEARPGITGGDFYFDPKTRNSINALRLPNRGFPAYLSELASLRPKIEQAGSKLWVSLATGEVYSPANLRFMGHELVEQKGASVIEVDWSCPNLVEGGKPKLAVYLNLRDIEKGLDMVRQGIGQFLLAAKIGPTTEVALLNQIADICLDWGVDYLVFANTIPNQRLTKADGTPALAGGLLGGLGGRALRPLVLNMIKQVGPKIKNTLTRIIAVGGTETGVDAYEYLVCGRGMVTGFQFNTVLSRGIPPSRVVDQIIFGLPEVPGVKKVEPGLLDLLVAKGLPW